MSAGNPEVGRNPNCYHPLHAGYHDSITVTALFAMKHSSPDRRIILISVVGTESDYNFWEAKHGLAGNRPANHAQTAIK